MANEPNDNKSDDQVTLIEFPCNFPIKVMGEAHEEFGNLILSVIQQHLPDFDTTRIDMRASTGGKYVSLTCTVLVHSKLQLDAIYLSLTSDPKVKYVL